MRSSTLRAVLGALSVTFAAGCGGGSSGGGGGGGSSSDAYEYVTGWALPDGGALGGLYLAASSQLVYASLYEVGDPDSVHVFQADGTYVKDLVPALASHVPAYAVDRPLGIAIGGSGAVCVVDDGHERVLTVDPINTEVGGVVVTSYAVSGTVRRGLGVAYSGGAIYVTGSDGDTTDPSIERRQQGHATVTASHLFPADSDPVSVASGPGGFLYVVDRALSKVYKLDADLNVVREWGSPGSGQGQFNDPYDIAVGSDGTVFVLDTGNYRVQLFDADGSYLGKFGSHGTGAGQFQSAFGLAVSSDGFVYVGDMVLERIQKFRKKP